MTTLQWVYGFASKLTTSIPGATVADAIEWDGSDILANTKNQAWRGIDADGKEGLTIQWRRAGEGETSRDGLWVVGGGQWRFGC
jgi:hypothetical protein